MRKNVFLLILLFFVEPLLANAEDLETGKWNFVIDDDYCFIQRKQRKTARDS